MGQKWINEYDHLDHLDHFNNWFEIWLINPTHWVSKFYFPSLIILVSGRPAGGIEDMYNWVQFKMNWPVALYFLNVFFAFQKEHSF